MTTKSLKGANDLIQFLHAFPERLQKNAVRAGLTAAAKPIREEARLRAPRQTGKLAKAIRTGKPRVNQDGTVSVRIRLSGEHAYLGIFHEYGVGPHLITAGDSKLTAKALNKRGRKGGIAKLDNGLVKVGGYTARTYANKDGDETGSLVIDRTFVGGAVFHPGIAAHPFMRPALDLKADEAINAFGKRIQDYLKGKTGFTGPLLETADEE